MRRVYARAGRAARLPTARPARRARSAAATAQGVHPSAATLATVKATVPTVTKSTCCSRIAASPGRPRRGLHRSQAEQPSQCRRHLSLPFGSVGTRTLARAKPTDRTMCRPKTTGPRQKLRGSSCTNWLGICVEWCRRSPRCGSDFAISMDLWWLTSVFKELEWIQWIDQSCPLLPSLLRAAFLFGAPLLLRAVPCARARQVCGSLSVHLLLRREVPLRLPAQRAQQVCAFDVRVGQLLPQVSVLLPALPRGEERAQLAATDGLRSVR